MMSFRGNDLEQFRKDAAAGTDLPFHSTGRVRSGASQLEEVKQAHRTVTRRWDEPKLEIGAKIPMEEGLVGVVLARYTRSGDARNDVYYIVEILSS